MDNHYRNITFKGDILKEKPMVISGHARHASIIIVPYLFLDINGEKKFICNLMRGTDESSGRDVRLETAKSCEACAVIISSTSPAMRKTTIWTSS